MQYGFETFFMLSRNEICQRYIIFRTHCRTNYKMPLKTQNYRLMQSSKTELEITVEIIRNASGICYILKKIHAYNLGALVKGLISW